MKLHVVDLSALTGRYTMVLKENESLRSQQRTMCYAVSHKPSHILGLYFHICFRNVNEEYGIG